MDESKKYKVILTSRGKVYFWQLIEYVFKTHSLEGARKKVYDLLDFVDSLSIFPNRGKVEEELTEYTKRFHRYLIYPLTKRNTIKIIYFIDKVLEIVYISEFFSNIQDPSKITDRN